ncbi:MAG: sensor histidine kinase [Ruminococcus sp.]
MMIIFNAVELLGNFAEAFCMFRFCDLFIKNRIKKPTVIFSCICLAFLTLLFNNISLLSPVLSFVLIGVYYLTQLLLRRTKPVKLFLLTLLYIALVFVIDFISTSILNMIIKSSIAELIQNYSLERIPVLITSKLILIFIVDVFHKFSCESETNKKANIILSISSIVIIMIASLMYYTQLINNEYNTNPLIFFFFIIMLIMIVSIYFIIANIIKNEEKNNEFLLIKQQNDLLNKYISEQEEVFLSWKESIHNHKHKLIAINQMLMQKQYSDAEEYIEKELELFKDKAFYVHTGNNIIDVLLSNKMSLAKKHGITFTTNISIAGPLKMSDVDLSVILGNLLDNAIEAVQSESEKNIYLQISANDTVFVIKAANTYTKPELTTETRKDKKFHGIGIKSIKNIVSGYGGEFTLTLEDGLVTASVII